MKDIDAYKEILAVLKKHEELIKNDHNINIINQISNRISLEETSKKFGIKLKRDSGPEWCRISDWQNIGLYGEKYRRTISWSDDDKQPKDEWLYHICFSTGAYIFGDSYPTETFNTFFVELKSYKPKYSDSHNHSLYFTHKNAKAVHDNFNDIYEKHRKLVTEEVKKNRVIKLKEELDKIEKGE